MVGLIKTIKSVNAAYTLTAYDDVVTADATSAAFAVTLPLASTVTGVEFVVKKIDSSAYAVTLTAAGSDKIDGSGTCALSSQYSMARVISDGTNWQIISKI